MAAVAAPNPEADPVTIAYKPSLDIRFLLFLKASFRRWHTISRSKVRANRYSVSWNKPCDRLRIPPLQAALLPALVRPMAFPHHKAQEKTAPRPEYRPEVANQHRGAPWRRVRTLLSRPRRRSSPISPMPRPSITTRRARG